MSYHMLYYFIPQLNYANYLLKKIKQLKDIMF